MDNTIAITGNTYRTFDYEVFKPLEGNRPVLASRVEKIFKSIKDHGYIYNPIVVNEKMEIIDGQGRKEALQKANLPIDYVIAPGTGLEQCVALNSSTTQWTIKDYIDSYCTRGFSDYIRLRNILEKYAKTLGQKATIMLTTGRSETNSASIKNGRFELNAEREITAIEDLDFALKFKNAFSAPHLTGRTEYYYFGVVLARKIGADESRLVSVMSLTGTIPSCGTVRQALNNISDIYNKGLSKTNGKRLYLSSDYEQMLISEYGWYKNKWLKEKA